MRLIAVMICMVLMVPQTFAIGVATLTDFSEEIELDVGEEKKLEFIIKGDAENNADVVFYIFSDNNRVLFNGNPTYSRSYVLKEFGEQLEEIEMIGFREGDDIVTWGYREPSLGENFNIDSVTETSFEVDVRGKDNFDVNVNTEDETTTGGGGGSGGSVFLEDLLNESQDPRNNNSNTNSNEEVSEGGVILQDSSAQNSAVNQITADEDKQTFRQAPFFNVNGNGQNYLRIVLVIGLVATLLTITAAFMWYKRGYNE